MVSVSELGNVFRRVESNSQRSVGELVRLCSQPSISATKEGLEECAELVEEMMRSSGLKVKTFRVDESAPFIMGEAASKRSDGHTLLFYNHYDVQPAEPLEEWEGEPFSPRVKDGRIVARGVADNKGSLVARLEAVRILTDEMGDLPMNIRFLVEGEEEVGSVHFNKFVEKNTKLLRSDGCLWEGGEKDVEGRPTIYLGMKGILYLELQVETGTLDLHSMWAPVAPNPAWRLAWLLNSMKGTDEKIGIEGFYDDVKAPSEEELKLLERIPLDREKQKIALGLKGFLKDYSNLEFLQNLYFNPTCTICGFDSGYKGQGSKTVNPCKAIAKLDFRLVPNQRSDDILTNVKAHLARYGFGDVKVVKYGSAEPCRTSPNTLLVRALVEAGRSVYSNNMVVEPNSPGSGPMSVVVEKMGIPIASGECVAHAASRYHAPNENIFVQDFIEGVKHIASTLLLYPTLTSQSTAE